MVWCKYWLLCSLVASVHYKWAAAFSPAAVHESSPSSQIFGTKEQMAWMARKDIQLFTNTDDDDSVSSRRQLIVGMPSILLAALSHAGAAHAVMMEQPKEKIFKAGETLGAEQAKARFQEARKTLDYLLDNYDEISKGGGDAVRRYLGTVGTESAMFGIMRVLKELRSECDDIVEYSESMDEFNYFLTAADTAVYSANFVEFSAAKTKPEKFFADAKADAMKMKIYMDKLAAELGMK